MKIELSNKYEYWRRRLLTAPLLSLTVRLKPRVVDTCGVINTGLAVLGNTPTLGPAV
jgi:hypothetical protein